MSSVYAADQLADQLDHALPPHGQVVADHDSDPLVDTALRLARGPHPTMSLDQVNRIEKLVLARAVRTRTRRPVKTIVQWAAAACLIVALITTGTARVSAKSLPGEPFYPVKRLVERGRLVLSSDTGDVDLRLEFADRRLDEFETLLDRGEINLDPLNDAIQEMNSALALVEEGNGSRDRSVEQLVKLSSRQVRLTEQAENRVDDSTAGELHNAAAEAEQVAEEARDLLNKPTSRFTGDETVVIIPQDMLEQASAPQRLQIITPRAPSETPASEMTRADEPILWEQNSEPAADDRTPTPAGNDDPPFKNDPTEDKTPPTDKPTATDVPPTPTEMPTLTPTDVPVSTDQPTEEIPPTDQPVPTDEPPPTDVPASTDQPTEDILPTDQPTPTGEPLLEMVTEPQPVDDGDLEASGDVHPTDVPSPEVSTPAEADPVQPTEDEVPGEPVETDVPVEATIPPPTGTPIPTEFAP